MGLSHTIKTQAGEDVYLIWSHEHGAWWRPHRQGYTQDHRLAGFYTRTDAMLICAGASRGQIPGTPFNELPVRLADVMDFHTMGTPT